MAINTLTLRIRKNGTNGTSIIQLSSGQTGQFEDITNSDTFTASDEINYSAETGGNLGTLVINHIGLLITNNELILPTVWLKGAAIKGCKIL